MVLTVLLAGVLLLPVSADGEEAHGDFDAYVTYPDCPDVGPYLLLEVQSGAVLCARAEDRLAYPASLVKLMTGYLAFLELEFRMDEPVTLTADMLRGTAGRSLQLQTGEIVTGSDLLHGLLVGGYNDCASALAVLCAGSVGAFVERMNETASALGMAHTSYLNPTGLHEEGMVTTAADTARLCRAILQIPELVRMTSLPVYSMPATDLSDARQIWNRNDLVSNYRVNTYYDPTCRGLNAGMTDEGGFCLATTRVDGTGAHAYLCIVLGGRERQDGKITSMLCAGTLLDWADSAFSWQVLARAGTPLLEIPVSGGLKETVPLGVEKDLLCFLPRNEKIRDEVERMVRLTADRLRNAQRVIRMGNCNDNIRTVYVKSWVNEARRGITDPNVSLGV